MFKSFYSFLRWVKLMGYIYLGVFTQNYFFTSWAHESQSLGPETGAFQVPRCNHSVFGGKICLIIVIIAVCKVSDL